MNAELEDLVRKHRLSRLSPLLERFAEPAVSFDLRKAQDMLPAATSKIGGGPDLEPTVVWPVNSDRPLDFLVQIDLGIASQFDVTGTLPDAGLLAFFYDQENMPWGFDPKHRDGFKVIFSPDKSVVERRQPPELLTAWPEFELEFRRSVTFPNVGSRAFDRFDRESGRTEDESEDYWDFVSEAASLDSSYRHQYGGNHHLLGHSQNVQGDMQLEAALVTNGLYCGDLSAYEDPRAAEIEKTADDWILLLQLDSDDEGGFMWGDAGMLYYWIRRDHLAGLNFDDSWLILQCG